MTKYIRGSKIECKATVKDSNEVVTTPTDLTLEVFDNTGTLIITKTIGDLTNLTTGVYTYLYPIPTDAAYGDWKYVYTGTTVESKLVKSKYFTIDAFDSSLYCSTLSVYRKAGIESTVIDEDDVADHIVEVMAEINEMFQRSFGNAQSKTQWIDVEDIDDDDEIFMIFLDYRPVQTITSMVSYDRNDTVMKTWAASDYWADLDTGVIRLRTQNFSHQNNRVKVIYTYGYTEIPVMIRSLTSIMSAMRILIQQIGGTYDDVTSYSLPSGVSIGVGEPYMNMTRAIEKLKEQRDSLIKSIGQLRQNLFVI